VNADDPIANADFTDDVILLEDGSTKDGGVKLDGTIHIGGPDDIFKAFYFHGGLL
jgi:hypothetical protein